MLSKKFHSALNKIPRILNESTDLNFKTTIDDDYVDFQPDEKNLPEGVMSVGIKSVSVVWELDIEQKDWGIREFFPEIKEVYGLKSFEASDPEKKDWEEDAQWNVKEYNITFETEKMAGGFRPLRISIDEQAKTMVVTFGEGML